MVSFWVRRPLPVGGLGERQYIGRQRNDSTRYMALVDDGSHTANLSFIAGNGEDEQHLDRNASEECDHKKRSYIDTHDGRHVCAAGQFYYGIGCREELHASCEIAGDEVGGLEYLLGHEPLDV